MNGNNVTPDLGTTKETETATFKEWCILELFGHRKLAGLVEEVEVAGHGFLRFDMFRSRDMLPCLTQFYNPSAVYSFTPSTEDICRKMAVSSFRPVTRYELTDGDEDDREF